MANIRVEEVGKFAEKPTSIIYVGIIVLLAISEWRSPSTSFAEIVNKIFLLIISFIIVTVFNSLYFAWYNKRY